MASETAAAEPTAPSSMTTAVGGLRELLDGKPTLAAARGISRDALDSIYGVAHELYANGHHAEALRSFEMLCLYDHENPRHWQALGVCRQVLQDYAGAAEALAFAAGQLDAPDAELQVNLAECLIAAGALDAAADALGGLAGAPPLDEAHAGRVRVLEDQLRQLRSTAPPTAPPTKGADHG